MKLNIRKKNKIRDASTVNLAEFRMFNTQVNRIYKSTE